MLMFELFFFVCALFLGLEPVDVLKIVFSLVFVNFKPFLSIFRPFLTFLSPDLGKCWFLS